MQQRGQQFGHLQDVTPGTHSVPSPYEIGLQRPQPYQQVMSLRNGTYYPYSMDGVVQNIDSGPTGNSWMRKEWLPKLPEFNGANLPKFTDTLVKICVQMDCIEILTTNWEVTPLTLCNLDEPGSRHNPLTIDDYSSDGKYAGKTSTAGLQLPGSIGGVPQTAGGTNPPLAGSGITRDRRGNLVSVGSKDPAGMGVQIKAEAADGEGEDRAAPVRSKDRADVGVKQEEGAEGADAASLAL